MKQLVSLDVNGEKFEFAVAPYAVLLDVLRDQLGIMGPKRGCDTGGCGCCTVLIDGKSHYSCMTYAATAQDKEITTVEGLVNDAELHPLQQAFVDHGAVQCGYCSSGFIMAARELLDSNRNPTRAEIRRAIAGNLCRCTGYTKIVDAIEAAAAAAS